jgi:choline dehydrogenase-like flavoprotein
MFKTTEAVDFVIVGAGAAGGVLAKELSTNGFSVVVLEQGPRLNVGDFRHDEYWAFIRNALTNNWKDQPNTYRKSADEKAKKQPAIWYGRLVGGGSVHFTSNYWRFHEIDFKEVSTKGTVAGTGLADWPISYADLEPYYTKAEWELGVSGLAGASPFDPPRSKPYPLPLRWPSSPKGIGVARDA